jgi:ADP-heptose:LPS heptosyltransferase
VDKRSWSKIPGRRNSLLRLADRYVGIPLIGLLGRLRKRAQPPCRVDRIGILVAAAIGDTVLCGAVVSDLRYAFPTSRIVFFAGETNYSTAVLLPGPDTVIQLPVYRPLAAARIVKAWQLDLLVDFGTWARVSALIAVLSGSRFTVGFRTSRQYRHYGYDWAVEHSSEMHELQNLRRLVTWLGIEAAHLPAIDLSKLPPNAGIANSAPYLLFHLWPGGRRHREKAWPVDRWICLIDRIAACGYGVVLSGAPSQHGANGEVIDAVHERYRKSINNAAGLSLPETAALAANARLVVSVDTGIMHLAAALRVPLIALHGPTSSKRWGPISSEAVAIDSPHSDAGYLYLGFEFVMRPPRCMETISCDSVFEECLRQLDQPAN